MKLFANMPVDYLYQRFPEWEGILREEVSERGLRNAVRRALDRQLEKLGKPLYGGKTPTVESQTAYDLLKFAYSDRTSYVLGKDFAEELWKVPLALTWDQVPNLKHPICIELPEFLWVVLPDTTFTSAVVSSFNTDGQGISMYWVNKFDPYWAGICSTFVHNGVGYETIQASLDSLAGFKEMPSKFQRATALILNTLLYIESGTPDLRLVRPPSPSQAKRFSNRILGGAGRPYTLVGFGFKKPVLYTNDSTHVRAHFRWQQCGPRLQQRKLIWIDAHIRHFDNVRSPNDDLVP